MTYHFSNHAAPAAGAQDTSDEDPEPEGADRIWSQLGLRPPRDGRRRKIDAAMDILFIPAASRQ